MKNLITFKKFLGLFFLTTLLFTICSCSKSEDNGKAEKKSSFFSFFLPSSSNDNLENLIQDNSVYINKISQDSPIFAFWDTTKKEYKEAIKNNPNSFDTSFVENLKFSPEAKKYIKIAKKIFKTDKIDPATFISKGSFFVEKVQDTSFPMALYVDFEKNLDIDLLKEEIKNLSKDEYDVKEIKIDDKEGLQITLKKDGQNTDFALNVFFKDLNKICVSNSQDLIKRFYDDDFNSNYVEKLYENEDFKATLDKVIDNKLINISTFVVLNNDNLYISKNDENLLKDIPFTNLIATQGLCDKDDLKFVAKYATKFNAKNEAQEKIINSLKNNSEFQVLPQNTVVSAKLNATFLTDLLQETLQKEKFEEYKDVSGMDSINVIVTEPIGSFFPNLSIVIENPKSKDKLVNFLKGIVDNAKTQVGAGAITWQQKKIADNDLDYIMTPLGVGIFILNGNNDVYISTSEIALQSLFDKASKEFAKEINEKFYLEKPSIFKLYSSSKAYARTLNTIYPSISPFLRGSQGKDIKDLVETLKKSPDMSTSITYEDGIFSGNTTYLAK